MTGGAGFIGSHLVESLLASGKEVTVLDDFTDYYDPALKERNVAGFVDEVKMVRGNIEDGELVERLFKDGKFEAVVHLAARAGVRPSIEKPRAYFKTNVDGTLNLVEACRNHGTGRFIFGSSSSVYGVNRKVPFSEEDRIERTISPYAATKLTGEQICSNYSHLFGIEAVCLRFFTVYGPRQRPDLAISKFTDRILKGESIPQYGDGSTARDYTYVEDIVQGIRAALEYQESRFDIFNLGGSETTRLSELISHLEELCGKEAKIELLPEQPGDVPRTFADTSKAINILGYRPGTNIRQGLAKYVEWHRGNVFPGA